ncbi:MAG: class I SAM-dependent methyltransferase [Lachnospiraceae bacterium]|nr:class I SAM-dependent methyltransferase [Lachnospiraceae bacterium]
MTEKQNRPDLKETQRKTAPDVKLSERLKMVADLAGSGIETLADVGCDHGWLGISLLIEGKADRVIGMDLRKGPLSHAEENAKLFGLDGACFETRLSDGLDELSPGEADVIVMAGIGGVLMCVLLTRGLEVAKAAKRLVLSPQSHIESVREFLVSEGFEITDERMCRENGKYYTAMCVSHVSERQSPQNVRNRKAGMAAGKCEAKAWALTDEELFFGPVLIKKSEPLFYEYVRAMHGKAKKRIGEINGKDPEKEEYFRRLLVSAEKILSKLEKDCV